MDSYHPLKKNVLNGDVAIARSIKSSRIQGDYLGAGMQLMSLQYFTKSEITQMF